MAVEPEIFPPNDMAWHKRAMARFLAPFLGLPSEEISFSPIVLSFAAVAPGHSIREFYEKPEFGIMCVAYMNELCDLLPTAHWFFSNSWIDALGAKLGCTSTLPWIVQEPRPIGGLEDVEKLEAPMSMK